MTLDILYDKLLTYDSDGLIDKIRMSPDKSRIVVDVNFNRALTIKVDNNKIIVEGDPVYADKLKTIIQEVL